MALFLAVAGLTGSLLAFYPELAHVAVPPVRVSQQPGMPTIDPFTLREMALALEPRGRIQYVALWQRPGEATLQGFEPRAELPGGDATVLPWLYQDPQTGHVVQWELPTEPETISPAGLLSLVYDLHWQLALGRVGWAQAGRWLFGMAAVLWTVDAFVGLILTLPPARKRISVAGSHAPSLGRRWAASWKIKAPASTYRRQLDLHRAGGLLLWALLLVFAWSSVYFNLGDEVYRPVMTQLFPGMRTLDRQPTPDLSTPRPDPAMAWRDAHQVAQRLMAEQSHVQGWQVNAELMLSYEPRTGLFRYTGHSDRDVASDADQGATSLWFDAIDGRLVGVSVPTGRNAGDTITSWIVALHRARWGGWAYKVLVSVVGLATAMLAFTGVYLWIRKRRARRLHATRQVAQSAMLARHRPSESGNP